MVIAERVKRAADRAGGVPALAKQVKVGRQTLYDIIVKGHLPGGRILVRLLAHGVLKRSDLARLDQAA